MTDEALQDLLGAENAVITLALAEVDGMPGICGAAEEAAQSIP